MHSLNGFAGMVICIAFILVACFKLTLTLFSPVTNCCNSSSFRSVPLFNLPFHQASMSMETGLSSTGAPSTSTSGVSQRSRMQPVVPPKIMRRDIHGMSEEAQHNILREQRALRQREIDDSGWASDIHKPYKPLGAPDLEREMPAPQLTSKTPRALARKNMMARAGKKQAGNGALGAGERRAGGDGMEESKSTVRTGELLDSVLRACPRPFFAPLSKHDSLP